MSLQKSDYTLVSSENVLSGYFNIKKNIYLTPDNREKVYHVLVSGDASIVLAITPDKKVVLVKQFRVSHENYTIELPAGKLEKGEDPKEGARREMLEETGYDGDLEFICTLSKGHNNSGHMHVFFCNNAYLKQETNHTDFEHGMQVVLEPLDEFLKKLHNQEIIQTNMYAFVALWMKNIQG